MKKFTAMLLTGCLVLQSCPGFAIPVKGDDSQTAAPAVTNTAADSSIEVEVQSSKFFPYTDKVSVEITGSSIIPQTRELDFTSRPISAMAKFEVPNGDYHVTVKADKCANYEQKISVDDGWANKIIVSAVKTNTGDDKTTVGWIRPGDITGDAKIDKEDTDSMLSILRETQETAETGQPAEAALSQSSNSNADLNGDGKIDIADLQCMVQSMGEDPGAFISSIEKFGIPKDVTIPTGTSIEGSTTLEEFLKEQKGISLKRSDEQPISKDAPLEMEFALAESGMELEGMTIQAPILDEENGTVTSAISEGTVTVTDTNDEEHNIPLTAAPKITTLSKKIRQAFSKTAATAKIEADGSLVLDFGGQIAVKKVSIKITGTTKNAQLVDIAKVEFVNNMESRIPAPQLGIPTLEPAVPGNEELNVSWNQQENVTGYELFVKGPVKKADGEQEQIIGVSGTGYTITAINDKPLKNFAEYTIKVRSVNGEWKSAWSKELKAKPAPQEKPAPPDNLNATGGYLSVSATWKAMDDASGYMLYYKKSSENDNAYKPVTDGFELKDDGTGRLETNHYTITGLEDNTEYSLYVVGWNEKGWGEPSLKSLVTTKSTALPELPNYNRLNTSNGTGKVTAHIVDAVYGGSGAASMVQSPLDMSDTAKKSALGLVDDNYASYWSKTDWDDGATYPANDKGMTITLDNDYKMGYMTFAAADQKSNAGLHLVSIQYYNTENGGNVQSVGARLIEKLDLNNNPYYIVKFNHAITANKVWICLGRSWGNREEMKVGEIRFHNYDSLDDDIMRLYTDEMHTTLRPDVTEQTIQELETRLETVDEASGEKHPLYKELSLEIKTAREILNTNLAPSYEVENQITAKKDGHLGFGGLNPWQPLGKVAYAGESLLVYVGHNTKRTGDSTDLQLIMTQYHAESSNLSKAVSLKIGRNEITVPQIADKDVERGGQLYIAYTGNNADDKYAVRISGGSSIPVLNLYGKVKEERTKAITAYIEELETYAAKIEKTHKDVHTGQKNVDYDYDKENCILNATDIMMEKMMYSLPATQVLAGMNGASNKVTKLDNALRAMEDTMTLFYQHKGLSNEAGTARGNNALPAEHLNIRYMRMFAGAFMYASGNHIGIEWGSTPVASSPNDWSGFGWGIAHEIGHDINQGTYAIAEITNNYFAQLLTKEPGKTRFDYKNVYEKVTSGTIGRSSNVATQLALYWQLHLAYDNNKEDRHIYDNYEEQFKNLFFGRVDTYSRNPSKAPLENPKENEDTPEEQKTNLKLTNDVDQNLMRLSCAAAEKNILPFFERWGMVPDEKTKAYAAKFGEPETKALYYVNDDARDYRVDHIDKATGLVKETGTVKDKANVVTASAIANSNQVEINISTAKDRENLILGYEIIRGMTSNGKKESKVIGFQPIDTAESTVFTDTISTINNRVMSYEVRAVDKFLNYADPVDAGSVKIQTDGVLNKELWTVETNMTSKDDVAITPDKDDPDSGYDKDSDVKKTVHSIDRVLDNQTATAAGIYTGTSTGTAEILIDMQKTESVTSLKYQGDPLEQVTVSVSNDNISWTTVKNTSVSGSSIIWFNSVKEEEDIRNNWIGTYDARYVKLTIAQSGSISIKEIDVCGPSGDNLEFILADGQPAIGILEEDYQYDSTNTNNLISKGALIFTGTYKGNPAYNVVILYDTEGNVIGAKDGNVESEQVIFADVPKNGNLGETSDGTWVYYVKPGQWDEETLKKISGVRGELYRVDDARTLEGERIVSDTTVIEIPETLPKITLTGNK